MHIVLLILKIIGIALLVILGLLLVILLMVLFVPIRYRIKGNLHDKVPVADARVSFLFPLFWVEAGYEQELFGRIKLLGITVYDLIHPKKKEKKEKKRRTNRDKRSDKNETEAAEVEKTDVAADGNMPEIETVSGHELQSDSAVDAESASETKSGLTKEHEDLIRQLMEKEENKKSFSEKVELFIEKLKEFFVKVQAFFRKLRENTQEMIDKLNDSVTKVSGILDFIESDEFQKAFFVAKKTIFKLLKSIAPRKIKISLHIGTGDPGSTGQICAIYGFLYPFVENCVMIEPDFEQTIMEGEFFLKGYITGFMFLRVAWVALFHRDLKCIRKMIRKRR